MKVLLDTCIWRGVKSELMDAGYDVVWSGDWEQDPGDETILTLALDEKRVLVTLDSDFGELAILRGFQHCGIIRLVNLSVRQQAKICRQILERYGEELLTGALATDYADRVRIRPAN